MMTQIHQQWQQGFDDATIAAELTALGYHTARSDRLTVEAVGRLRLEQGWRRNHARDHVVLPGHLSVQELADLLGVSRTWIYGRIRRKRIPAKFITRHPDYDRLFLRNDPQLLAILRAMKDNAHSK